MEGNLPSWMMFTQNGTCGESSKLPGFEIRKFLSDSDQKILRIFYLLGKLPAWANYLLILYIDLQGPFFKKFRLWQLKKEATC